ncbi:MAG: protein-glutamate methylesterase/protein-glutamine glutaminase [Halanaerobiaceae bacterium]
MPRLIKVLVVDDSALVRKILSDIFTEEPGIKVVAAVSNPLQAVKKIKDEEPDVITLDLQMPKMDGLTFLQKIMNVHPLPVIVISSLTQKGSRETIKALELGALDFVAKPEVGIRSGLEELKADIVKKVKGAAGVNLGVLKKTNRKKRLRTVTDVSTRSTAIKSKEVSRRIKLIAIGASTGGTVAVRQILKSLPAKIPGIVIVLHMPPLFTASFAENLDKSCRPRVKEAEDGEKFVNNTVYIAEGDKHLVLEQGVSDYFFQTDRGPKINHVRPSIDKTFSSIAEVVAPNCIGIILTGMGSDGVEGLGELQARGALTVAQDRDSSVVFGMPGKAVEEGVVNKILSLKEISKFLLGVVTDNEEYNM